MKLVNYYKINKKIFSRFVFALMALQIITSCSNTFGPPNENNFGGTGRPGGGGLPGSGITYSWYVSAAGNDSNPVCGAKAIDSSSQFKGNGRIFWR
jgi:hypothetical protein